MEGQQPRRTARQRPSRHRSAVDRVRDVQFPLVLRGYDRSAVDDHLAQIAQLVAELEATQLRDNVVQKALDEVGEQTSGILQRAHETAEEIAARSRSQAEGRIQRAEREAQITRQEADKYSEQIVQDTRRLWEDRRKLIEEMRQFAEDVLSVADDAFERLPERPPEPPRPGQQQPPASAEDETVQIEAAPPADGNEPATEVEPEPVPPAEPPQPAEPAQPLGDAEPIESVRRIERVKPGTPGRDQGA
jgi:DivIVA domain-containing protein